jgi:hypothetical protein
MITGSWLLLTVMAGTSYFLASWDFALSVFVGGILAIANFYWLRSVLLRSLQLQPKEAPRFAVVRFVVRLAVLAVIIFTLIAYCRIDIIGLLVGLSVLVLTIGAMSIFMISAKGD